MILDHLKGTFRNFVGVGHFFSLSNLYKPVPGTSVEIEDTGPHLVPSLNFGEEGKHQANDDGPFAIPSLNFESEKKDKGRPPVVKEVKQDYLPIPTLFPK